ncbi:hypothetical protein ALC56_13938 [Trachymyrmex septentrionalis]|uniref:Uncharacterized protein n=1 Tax=Trachymyrmex septentrionalis TaxID=34720 RepID=A0A195EV86_9HYME|nr:hypothetical protein ALC56_13938 [Trachymyrmex septentrionalis]
MDYKIPVDLSMSYLRAIQKIPGDTAGEKFSWIGRLALHQTSEDVEQFPPELLPLLHVETAVKKKRHKDITSALKSDDLTIINRAFKATWFFDGSYKEIVNVAYFCEHLFPYVSVKTRMRIVKTLGYKLKDPVFAQQMFIAVESIYDFQTAYPLFLACDTTFAYDTIVKKGFVLPAHFVKHIFRKNLDLAVRFLKLFSNSDERTPFPNNVATYESLLPKLIKKRPEDFVELFEAHESSIIRPYYNKPSLSNTRAKIFLKKAKQHLIKKPRTYIHMLKKQINEHLMEKIFLDLLPEKESLFSTYEVLEYLRYYPDNKIYELLRKSYESKYDKSLLTETKNITEGLLKLLPLEERIKQARIMFEKVSSYSYEENWICYLPVNEAIPYLKEQINKTKDEKERSELIEKMMQVCKNNKDDDALSDTLMYFLKRHKNENRSVFQSLFSFLRIYYHPRDFNKKQLSLIIEIIQLFYVKNEFVSEYMFQFMVYFRLKYNMPMEELVDICIEQNHERQWLVIFLNTIQKKDFEDFYEKEIFFKIIRILLNTIAVFNNRCDKWYENEINVEKLTIKDHPWLMDAIFEILRFEERSNKCSQECRNYYSDSPKKWSKKRSLYKKSHFLCNNYMHHLLQSYEPELYRSWFPSEENTTSVSLKTFALKSDLQNIQENWKEYLKVTMENYHCKQVHHFIRSMRWYKDLPIKFAEHCKDYIHDKCEDKISSSITILAILLHGEAVTKLIDSFVPTEMKVDTSRPNAKNNYKIVKNLPLSMRLSNPPIHFDLIIRLCVGGYLSIALMILTNVSRRTPMSKVISCVKKLTDMRVSVQKHGIRLIPLTSVVQQLDLYQKMLSTDHYSIQQVLFEAIQRLFFSNPKPETWSLYCQAVSSVNPTDSTEKNTLLLDIILKMIMDVFEHNALHIKKPYYVRNHKFIFIPNEYIKKSFDLWSKIMDKFYKMESRKIDGYIIELLTNLSKTNNFNVLPEEFIKSIIRRYLLHCNFNVSKTAISFTVSCLLQSKDEYITYFKVLTDVFHKANAATTYCTYCDKSQPLKKYNCQVNKIMHSFIDIFVIRACKYIHSDTSINPRVIDSLQILFSSILSPEQDAESYLLLVYMKKFQEVCNESLRMKAFGLKIGQYLPKLVDIFSPLLISLMASILRYFVREISDNYVNCFTSIIEGLVEIGNTYSYFMAVNMLPSPDSKNEHMTRYCQLFEKFQEMQEPAIETVLYKHFLKY